MNIVINILILLNYTTFVMGLLTALIEMENFILMLELKQLNHVDFDDEFIKFLFCYYEDVVTQQITIIERGEKKSGEVITSKFKNF